MKSELEFRDKRFALVLVDVQRKFALSTDGLKGSVESHLGTVNDAIRLFRDTGNPIIYVVFDGGGHGDEIEDGDGYVEGLITPIEGDLIVHKTEMNSFRKSDLAETVRNAGCTHILIAGMVAQFCVLATYFGAFDNDLVPYMLEGGLMSTDEHKVDLVEDLCKNLSVAEMSENMFFKS